MALEYDLCSVSGGLGPTHDDRTVELVARVAGRELLLDEGLHEEIGVISRRIAERLKRPYADFEPGVLKQATLPEGAHSLGLIGTAPGFVLETDRAPVVVLPGPPTELQQLWPRALETAALREVLARAARPGRRVLRFYGASESAVAKALADAGGDGGGVVATICARDFEIHVDLLVDPGAEARGDTVEQGLAEPLAEYLFTRDEVRVEELVLVACRERGWTLATAESCTGGLVAGRLTSVPGSSDVFIGGVVAYANEVKEGELGVPAALLAEHGAVSAEAAAAMAAGVRAAARRRCGRGRHGDRRAGRRDSGKAGRACLPARGNARGRAAGSSSRSRATARRSGRGRPSPRCICCGVFCHRAVTVRRDRRC